MSQLVEPRLPDLGVGVVYNDALEPLLTAQPGLIDVLEVEPQTLWLETRNADEPYVIREDAENRVAVLPWPKLIHSVGTPVGATVRAHAAQLPLLRRALARFGSPWASEHLSFNMTADFFTGFFLPPRQTECGLRVYVEAIKHLREALGVPLAIETPVNYLRPRRDEIPDGEFVALVAEGAGCGILLDLHNVYCNERNGRQPVARFLDALPLDRVWEVHLAGGFEMDGFWLDAHSGRIPDPLEAICREVIPALPQVRALVFELFASFVEGFGESATARELERLRGLWTLRRPTRSVEVARAPTTAPRGSDEIAPPTWELALGHSVLERPPLNALERELTADPGTRLVARLVKEFRASMTVGVYRLSCRLLMLTLGVDGFRTLLEEFWSMREPAQFAGTEADAFAEFILARELAVPQLASVLSFERSTLATLRDGTPRRVHFSVEPLMLLRALASGVLPNDLTTGEYVLEIADEGPVRSSVTAAARANGVVPYH